MSELEKDEGQEKADGPRHAAWEEWQRRIARLKPCDTQCRVSRG